MSQKRLTKEEKFLIALFKMSKKGDAVDSSLAARSLGLSDKVRASTVNILAGMNFLKKEEGAFVKLTSHGITFCKDHR